VDANFRASSENLAFSELKLRKLFARKFDDVVDGSVMDQLDLSHNE
jgi:hypothetical protein